METQVKTMQNENSGISPKLRTYGAIRGVTLARETYKGGCTIDFDHPTMDLANHSHGYYVAQLDGSTTFPLAGADTRNYQFAIGAAWRASNGSGLMGTWVHEGTVHTAPTEWFYSLKQAILVARQRGELAVWDIAKSQNIYV